LPRAGFCLCRGRRADTMMRQSAAGRETAGRIPAQQGLKHAVHRRVHVLSRKGAPARPCGRHEHHLPPLRLLVHGGPPRGQPRGGVGAGRPPAGRPGRPGPRVQRLPPGGAAAAGRPCRRRRSQPGGRPCRTPPSSARCGFPLAGEHRPGPPVAAGAAALHPRAGRIGAGRRCLRPRWGRGGTARPGVLPRCRRGPQPAGAGHRRLLARPAQPAAAGRVRRGGPPARARSPPPTGWMRANTTPKSATCASA
jgi:hypothetical protein